MVVDGGRSLKRGRPYLGIRGPESSRTRPQGAGRGSSDAGVSAEGAGYDREPVQQDPRAREFLASEVERFAELALHLFRERGEVAERSVRGGEDHTANGLKFLLSQVQCAPHDVGQRTCRSKHAARGI